MNRGTLTLSIVLLLAGLVGGLLLVMDLWLKNAPASPSSVASPPTLDGTLSEGEYAHTLEDEVTGITLAWSIVGGKVSFGLHGPGSGWLALGLDPDGPMMRGADILIGYVKDGQVFVEDHYGDTPTGHKADTELGGSDDVLAFAGSEDETGTTLEFERILITSDEHDKPVRDLEVFVQLAYAERDDWTTYHGKFRNTLQVNFYTGKEAQP